jgi:hypothetical protein
LGSGVRQVNHERITDHADELRKQVLPHLEEAGRTLNRVYDLEGGDFSIACVAAAVAYPGALQFAFETLRTHLDQVSGFADKLDATASAWRDVEVRNDGMFRVDTGTLET